MRTCGGTLAEATLTVAVSESAGEQQLCSVDVHITFTLLSLVHPPLKFFPRILVFFHPLPSLSLFFPFYPSLLSLTLTPPSIFLPFLSVSLPPFLPTVSFSFLFMFVQFVLPLTRSVTHLYSSLCLSLSSYHLPCLFSSLDREHQ